MTMPSPEAPATATLCVHATAVAIGAAGLLLRGPSGSGKSDLALRLVDGGGLLIADDQVMLRRDGDRLVAGYPPAAPAGLRGRLEVRGLGLLPVPMAAAAPLDLVIDLQPGVPVERLPAAAGVELLGVVLPLLRLDPFVASAAAQVRLAVRTLRQGIIPPS
jgi:HPr kinase/phosphorylase